MSSKEVQKVEQAELPAEVQALVDSARHKEIEKHGMETPSLKIVHGSELFKDGSGEPFKEFEGVLLAEQRVNIYWGEDSEVPICIAPDAVTGNKFGKCSQCQYNEWGSDPKGDGKACKNQAVLLVWRTDRETYVPYRINISPTGLKQDRSKVGKDIRGFANEIGLDSCGFIAKFSLEHKSDGSREWSVLQATSTGKSLRTKDITVEQWKEFHAIADACTAKAVAEEIKEAVTAEPQTGVGEDILETEDQDKPEWMKGTVKEDLKPPEGVKGVKANGDDLPF